VKFLLATTDPQKLPVTVLSRCLQFGLKRLPAGMIAAYLGKVLVEEGIPYEEEALRLLARAGDGSMRDALSLLDQAIAFGSGRVEQAVVAAMLGSIDRGMVSGLLEALAANDATALLQRVAKLDEAVPDYAAVLADLLSLLQQVALVQAVPGATPADGVAEPEDLLRLANELPPEDVQLFYQIALLGRRDLPLAPDPRGGFEMVLLRMLCFRPEGMEWPARASESAHREPVAVPAPPAQPVQAPVAAPPPGSSPARPISEWSGLVEQLGLGGMAKQLALNCALVSREGNHFRLALEPIHAQMLNKTSEERLKVALEQQLGTSVDLRFQVSRSALSSE